MQCPNCGSADTRRATVYWQCLTCERDWQEGAAVVIVNPDTGREVCRGVLVDKEPVGTNEVWLHTWLGDRQILTGYPKSWVHTDEEAEPVPGLDVEALREQAHKEWEIARALGSSDDDEQRWFYYLGDLVKLTDRYLEESK